MILEMTCSESIADAAKTHNKVCSVIDMTDTNYHLAGTSEILLTSEQGDRLASKGNVAFTNGKASDNVISVRPDIVKQTLHGIGTSFTESAAFVLAHLDRERRGELMRRIYGEEGANFSLARTVIGATSRLHQVPLRDCTFCCANAQGHLQRTLEIRTQGRLVPWHAPCLLLCQLTAVS